MCAAICKSISMCKSFAMCSEHAGQQRERFVWLLSVTDCWWLAVRKASFRSPYAPSCLQSHFVQIRTDTYCTCKRTKCTPATIQFYKVSSTGLEPWSSVIRNFEKYSNINLLNPALNPICYLLALLAHHFLHVSRIRVKSLTLRPLMSYIHIWSAYSWCF